MTQALPFDILREIASHVKLIDVYNLSLTSKWIRICIYPLLFHDIELLGYQQGYKVIYYLLLHPERARSVRSLVLRPSYLQMWSKKRLANERRLARAVEKLASNMPSLRRFVWDGIEVPASSMWASLRHGCSELKAIGTNLGCEQVDPDSELFAFSDLISFSLTSELHYVYLPFDMYNRNGEELPPALWTMLVDRCPRLRSLKLGDRGPTLHNRRTISVRPLVHGRWPHLQSLSISSARITNFLDFNPLQSKQYREFIDAHRSSLRSLSYCQFMGYEFDDRLPPLLFRQGYSLPRWGSHTSTSLLQEIILTGEAFCGVYLSYLKRHLGSQLLLRKLEVWLDLSESARIYQDLGSASELDVNQSEKPEHVAYDQLKELRELVQSCPRGLASLKLLVSTKSKETFYMRDIPQIIQPSTHGAKRTLPQFQLKHLEVWKVFRSREGFPGDAAIQIALAEKPIPCTSGGHSGTSSSSSPVEFLAPALETIVLVTCLNRWTCTDRMRIHQHAKYRVHRRAVFDEEVAEWDASRTKSMRRPQMYSGKTGDQVNPSRQMIVSLVANERGGELFPSVYTRRYNLQLGALMGASQFMMKGKRAGMRIVAANGAREWRLIKSDEALFQKGLKRGLWTLKRWIAGSSKEEWSAGLR